MIKVRLTKNEINYPKEKDELQIFFYTECNNTEWLCNGEVILRKDLFSNTIEERCNIHKPYLQKQIVDILMSADRYYTKYKDEFKELDLTTLQPEKDKYNSLVSYRNDKLFYKEVREVYIEMGIAQVVDMAYGLKDNYYNLLSKIQTNNKDIKVMYNDDFFNCKKDVEYNARGFYLVKEHEVVGFIMPTRIRE